MDSPFAIQEEEIVTRTQACIDATNRFLIETVIKCSRGEQIRDYFYVGIVGYQLAQDGKVLLTNLLPNPSPGMLHSIKSIADSPLKFEQEPRKVYDDMAGILEYVAKVPIWIERTKQFQATNSMQADYVLANLSDWVSQHSSAFPPTVLHLTDPSQLSDDLLAILKSLHSIKTLDGDTLILNCVLTTAPRESLLFPSATAKIETSTDVNILLESSSLLPERMVDSIRSEYHRVASDGKAFALVATVQMVNSLLATILRAFEIGTRPADLDDHKKMYDQAVDRIYRQRTEVRAEAAENRARKSHILSIIAVVIATIGLMVSLAETALRVIGILP